MIATHGAWQNRRGTWISASGWAAGVKQNRGRGYLPLALNCCSVFLGCCGFFLFAAAVVVVFGHPAVFLVLALFLFLAGSGHLFYPEVRSAMEPPVHS